MPASAPGVLMFPTPTLAAFIVADRQRDAAKQRHARGTALTATAARSRHRRPIRRGGPPSDARHDPIDPPPDLKPRAMPDRIDPATASRPSIASRALAT